MPSFTEEMSGWLKDGKVKQRETVAEGIENAPEALIGMLGGDNLGKQLVKVGDEPSVLSFVTAEQRGVKNLLERATRDEQ